MGWLIAASVLVWMLYWAGKNWDSPSMRGHEFRQSQTALSAQVMEKTGWKLAYETPVLGKPWSIPMEFPLYQWLVATGSKLSGSGTIPAGRWTALLMFLAGLPAWWLLGRMAGFSGSASALALVPILLAPVYIFYSRTVMIESTAWSLSAWFLWAVLRYREQGGTGALLLALWCGALAATVKGPTWAVFCLPWALLFLADAWAWLRHRNGNVRRLLIQAFGIGLPLLAVGFLWVGYADHLKEQNPVANFLLSRELREFNFGTWAARGEAEQWSRLGEHVVTGLVPLWAGIAVAFLLAWSRRSRVLAGLALAGFVAGPLVFFNLYVFHDYYFYANGAFACVLVGLVAAELWDRRTSGWTSALPAVAVLVVVGYAQFRNYRAGHWQTQSTIAQGDYDFTRLLRELTDPEDVIVVHSVGWSSSLAYFSQRRLLTIPDSQMFYHPDRVRAGVRLLEGEHVPLLLVVGDSRVQGSWTTERIDALEMWPIPLFRWYDTNVYARADEFSELREKLSRLHVEAARFDKSEHLLPAEQRKPIAGTEAGESVRHVVGITPRNGILPFGYDITTHQGVHYLLVHSVTELFFEVPEGAQKLEVAFRVNPASYEAKDFDGLCVLVEGVEDERIVKAYHAAWMSPHGDRSIREATIDLPEGGPDTIVFRVLAGPADSGAYDQLWLRTFRFE